MMKHSLTTLLLLIGVTTASINVTAAESFTVSTLKFEVPAGWTSVPSTSPMRKAELKVPGDHGAADVVFFHFGQGQGGSVQANIDRWYGQFAEPKDQIKARTEKKSAGGLEITYVFAEGTFLSGPPFGQKTPLKDHALIGAIIEDAAGDVYVKMTGPKTTTEKAEAAFKKMIETAKH